MTKEPRVTGALRQQASTHDIIITGPVQLRYISAAFTLEPGHLILPATPSGVGPLKPGDRVEVSVGGIGVLANTVEAEAAYASLRNAAGPSTRPGTPRLASG